MNPCLACGCVCGGARGPRPGSSREAVVGATGVQLMARSHPPLFIDSRAREFGVATPFDVAGKPVVYGVAPAVAGTIELATGPRETAAEPGEIPAQAAVASFETPRGAPLPPSPPTPMAIDRRVVDSDSDSDFLPYRPPQPATRRTRGRKHRGGSAKGGSRGPRGGRSKGGRGGRGGRAKGGLRGQGLNTPLIRSIPEITNTEVRPPAMSILRLRLTRPTTISKTAPPTNPPPAPVEVISLLTQVTPASSPVPPLSSPARLSRAASPIETISLLTQDEPTSAKRVLVPCYSPQDLFSASTDEDMDDDPIQCSGWRAVESPTPPPAGSHMEAPTIPLSLDVSDLHFEEEGPDLMQDLRDFIREQIGDF